MLHCGAIRQSVRIVQMDSPAGILRTGDRATVGMCHFTFEEACYRRTDVRELHTEFEFIQGVYPRVMPRFLEPGCARSSICV